MTEYSTPKLYSLAAALLVGVVVSVASGVYCDELVCLSAFMYLTCPDCAIRAVMEAGSVLVCRAWRCGAVCVASA